MVLVENYKRFFNFVWLKSSPWKQLRTVPLEQSVRTQLAALLLARVRWKDDLEKFDGAFPSNTRRRITSEVGGSGLDALHAPLI